MTVQESLDKLYLQAKEDDELRKKLLATQESKEPALDFCRISTEHGLPISAIDLVMAGEDTYAEMCRSTNGGGENHPRIKGADDLYSLFIQSIDF